VGSQSQLAPSRLPEAEALGERIADRIWLRTRRGVDLDMLWELRPVLHAIREGLSSWRLWRYDAVIVVALARPVGVLARLRKRGVQRLLRRVIREVGAASHVVVVSLEEQGASHDNRDRHPERNVTDGGGRDSDDGDVPRVSTMATSVDERTGADAVAAHLLDPLAAADAGGRDGAMDAAHRRRQRPDEETERQRAVDRLALRERHVGHRLQHVVDLAQGAFESASAEITVVDHDRQWTLVSAGERRGDLPRRDSLCSRSIEQPTPTLIGDTWGVPALRGNPLIAGTGAIRFYAAHPIESIEGYRIGVLCVWDDVPHEVEDFDVSGFRDLALLAEAEIIGGERT
jgi:GAF domain-containing protein